MAKTRKPSLRGSRTRKPTARRRLGFEQLESRITLSATTVLPTISVRLLDLSGKMAEGSPTIGPVISQTVLLAETTFGQREAVVVPALRTTALAGDASALQTTTDGPARRMLPMASPLDGALSAASPLDGAAELSGSVAVLPAAIDALNPLPIRFYDAVQPQATLAATDSFQNRSPLFTPLNSGAAAKATMTPHRLPANPDSSVPGSFLNSASYGLNADHDTAVAALLVDPVSAYPFGALGEEHVALSLTLDSQPRTIIIESRSFAPLHQDIVQFVVPMEASPVVVPSYNSVIDAERAAPILVSGWTDGAAAARHASVPTGLTAVPQVSVEALAPGSHGYAKTPANESSGAAVTAAGWAAAARVSQEVKINLSYGDASPGLAFAASPSVGRADGETAAEGGFVEIHTGSVVATWSPRSTAEESEVPPDSSSPAEEAAGAADVASDQDDLPVGTDLTSDEPAVSAPTAPLAVAEVSPQVSQSEEGGMVDLFQALPVEPSQTAIAAAESPGTESPLPTWNVRMEKGVARFQAFDLAAVPAAGGEDSPAAAVEGDGDKLGAETAPPNTTSAASPEPGVDRGKAEGHLLHSTAALPAIAAAALLTRSGQRLGRQSTRLVGRFLKALLRRP